MRFRKRISLGSGAHINISKSGVSLTGGVKGLSLSTGSKGTFLNTSIPGTGLYDRKQIGGSASKKHSASSKRDSFREDSLHADQEGTYKMDNLQVTFVYRDDATIVFKDPSGHEITNPALLKAIKDSPKYKEEVARLADERLQGYVEMMERIINIQQMTPIVYSTEEWQRRIENMRPQPYERLCFAEPEPSMLDVVRFLEEEAERTIEVRSRRKRDKLRMRYVDDTKGFEFDDRRRAWQARKDAFMAQEDVKEKQYYQSQEEIIESKKKQYMQLIQGNELIVNRAIDEWLSKVKFGFEFNLEYAYVGDNLYVDLDLPEIEDLPSKKAQRMANGAVKYKPKAQKEIKADYSKCVYGLAIYFAGNIFNRALGVQTIIVSGYTQRRNRSGDINDDYIYSIVFDRATFSSLDYGNDDPRENCMKFQNRVLQNRDLSFKKIDPYEPEEIQEA